MLTGSQVRRKFLDFFISKGHKEVHSSSLVPANDPTLLFTNAGMNQFKDVFLGLEHRDYSRATTSQKCVRAGGKHNDLENVGFTNRHHTFFEMLGNFSFGDYFKKDAIAYAWELVTSKDWFGIAPDKLYATIFEGAVMSGADIPRDQEAEKHWLAVGVRPERIFAMGMKDNFWQMGDTGPCGPCSEIHYDMGIAASDAGHTDCKFPCECGRYVEIWNLVFMQYNRDASGVFNPLPKPSIDTGAGLERVTAVLQNVISNYDTDLFVPLIQRAAELTGTSNHLAEELKREDVEEQHHQAASLRVIADHARAATFLISDGVLPSNEGRGYVLRKIMRRGIRHGRLLGATKPFLCEMVYAVCDLMKDAYPELVESAPRVYEIVKGEETRFGRTLNVGLTLLEVAINEVVFLNAAKALDAQLRIIVPNLQRLASSDAAFRVAVGHVFEEWQEIDRLLRRQVEFLIEAYDSLHDKSQRKPRAYQEVPIASGFLELRNLLERSKVAVALTENSWAQFSSDPIPTTTAESLRELRRISTPTLPGEVAFKLYDTEGLPRDFMEDTCRDAGIQFDSAGFDAAMQEQRERARASWKGGGKATASPIYSALSKTVFEGYAQTRSDNCEVLAIIKLPGSAEERRAKSEERIAKSESGGLPKISTDDDLVSGHDSIREGFVSGHDSIRDGLVSGHDFSRADQPPFLNSPSGLQPARGFGAQILKPGERGEIVLDHTPFYADSGGQVGDIGWLYAEDHNTLVAEVEGVTFPVQGVRAHRVIAKQTIRVGDRLDAVVNDEVRLSTMRNHTGTHLIHAALREVLGTHVKQAGSLVDPSHLRFDFSHFAGVGDEELQDIEDLANREVLKNDRVEVINDVPIDVAINEYKAMALFGEKYGDRVRVIRIGDFSTELCGGTHTAATGEIGLIKILKEGSVSSGVRRLEAVTGEGSLRHFRKDHQLENVVSTVVRVGDDQSPAEALKQELERREEELKKLRKELDQVRMKSAASSVSEATDQARDVKGVKVLATRADNLERPQLRTLIDNLRNKLGSGVVVLGSVTDGRVALIVGVTKDLTAKIQAGKIIAEVAKKVGGSGGGRPDMAEAGGKDPGALDAALQESYSVVERLLA